MTPARPAPRSSRAPWRRAARALLVAGLAALAPACGGDDAGEGAYLVTDMQGCRAELRAPSGEVLRSWEEDAALRWQRARLLPDGDLVVLSTWKRPRGNTTYVVRYDPAGAERWRTQVSGQHDLLEADDGELWVITRGRRRLADEDPPRRIRDNQITRLDREGAIGDWLSLYDVLAAAPDFAWRAVDAVPMDGPPADVVLPEGDVADLLQACSLQRLPAGSFGAAGGDPVLVCLRSQGRVVVVDVDRQDLLWSWGADELVAPVAAAYGDGLVHVLDGGTGDGPDGRLLSVDPDDGRVVRTWSGPEGAGFSTPVTGSLETLPGGGLLVGLGDEGLALVLSPSGEERWRGEVRGAGGGAAPLRVQRVDAAGVAALPDA